MQVKTKEETRTYLKNMAEQLGLNNEYEAASDVLLHYNMYDHNGSDRLFLAFCEEIVHEVVQ
jgi:hypothetical protein